MFFDPDGDELTFEAKIGEEIIDDWIIFEGNKINVNKAPPQYRGENIVYIFAYDFDWVPKNLFFSL